MSIARLDDLVAVLDRVVVGDGLAARLLDLVDDLVGRGRALACPVVLAAEVVDDDLRAARREEQRVGATEAVAGAGDDGDASIEPQIRHVALSYECFACELLFG